MRIMELAKASIQYTDILTEFEKIEIKKTFIARGKSTFYIIPNAVY